MFHWISNVFQSKSLEDVLEKRQTIKVRGVSFVLRPINVLDFLNGSDIVKKVYDNYKIGKPELAENLPVNEKKIREYYSQVLVAGVVSPALSFKDGEEGKMFVEKLFLDWDMAMVLYQSIMTLTYGKKKVKKRHL